jgi:proteasome beta subunit
VLALKFADGVVMAGDRRAVEGYSISDDEMNKVFPADDYSAVGIAGVAGQAIEMVRLFQTELEHYEKVEGEHLSLEGKANRLAQMVRSSFPLVMQGLVVVPIYAGFDRRRNEGRIFRYDVIGGRYEESDYAATGSGSRDAKASMKKRWRPDLAHDEAVEVAVEALVDAGEEDTATAGPDLIRGIFPTVHVVTTEGVEELADQPVRQAAETVIERRRRA